MAVTARSGAPLFQGHFITARSAAEAQLWPSLPAVKGTFAPLLSSSPCKNPAFFFTAEVFVQKKCSGRLVSALARALEKLALFRFGGGGTEKWRKTLFAFHRS